MAKLSTKARNAIASLSTGGMGTYYPSPAAFFIRLAWVLRDNGFVATQMEEDTPLIHTNDGRGRVEVTPLGIDTPLFDVVYTWHRMESGNWEMVCYPSC